MPEPEAVDPGLELDDCEVLGARVLVADSDPLLVPDSEGGGVTGGDGVGEGEHACLRPFSCTDGHVASSSHDAPPSVETRGAPGTPIPRAGTDTSPTTSYHDTGELDEMERRCACDTRVSATKEDGSATLMYCREERDERCVSQDLRCPETPSKDTRTTPGTRVRRNTRPRVPFRRNTRHVFRFVGQ